MRKGKLITIILLFIGLTFISNTFTFANKTDCLVFNQKHETIRISVKVDYLGNPLEGVVVSILDNGRILAKSTTNRKGKVSITIKDLKTKTVDMGLMKEGYKTQILSGMVLINKSKFEFSLVKGDGVSTTEVLTKMPHIKEESAIKIKEINIKSDKSRAKANEYSRKADKEDQKRREIEEKTSRLKRQLQNTKEDSKRMEEKLSQPTQKELIDN